MGGALMNEWEIWGKERWGEDERQKRVDWRRDGEGEMGRGGWIGLGEGVREGGGWWKREGECGRDKGIGMERM